MADSIHIHLISGQEFQVQPAGSLVKHVKEEILKLRGIALYEQTLVIDGAEAKDSDEVDPSSSFLLVIGASQLKNLVRDYMLGCQNGRLPRRFLWSRCPQSQLGSKAMLESCLHAARHSLPVSRGATWAGGVRPYLTEEDMEDYLNRCVTIDMALQAESQRNAKSMDPYEQDMLALEDGDIPMKAMIDYREKCWTHISTLSVEDAQRISRERDSKFADPLEQQLLRAWESGVMPGPRYLAPGQKEEDLVPQGMSQRELSAMVILCVDCHEPGTVLHSPPRDPWGDAEGRPGWQSVHHIDGRPWWKASSATLEQMEKGELDWGVGRWQGVIADDLNLDVKQCAVLISEPLERGAGRRAEISDCLAKMGVAAFGFASSLTMIALGQETLRPGRAAVAPELREKLRTGVFIDAGHSAAVFAPVFQGILLTDAMTHVDLSGDEAHGLVLKTILDTVQRCPMDFRLQLRSRIVVYGSHTGDELWQRLGSEYQLGIVIIVDQEVLHYGVTAALSDASFQENIWIPRCQYEGAKTMD